MDCLTKDLRELYERAKGYQQNQAPYPDYSTGRTDGFYGGVRYVFDKIAEQSNEPLTPEELREMDGEPVWVEIPEEHVSEWCIAKWDPLMKRMRLWGSGGKWFDGRNCGKSLFVYRHRPEEGMV